MAVAEPGAGWRPRLAAWRPEPRTAAVIIGGFFVYFAALGQKDARADLAMLTESCANPLITCDDVHLRLVAGGGLLATIAELVIVLGCTLVLVGARWARFVVVAGAGMLAAAQLVIALDWLPFPGATLASPLVWEPVVAAMGALVLGLLALRLPTRGAGP